MGWTVRPGAANDSIESPVASEENFRPEPLAPHSDRVPTITFAPSGPPAVQVRDTRASAGATDPEPESDTLSAFFGIPEE